MQFLLLVSIGPVQDFIASARRSRDLWFGSVLLSELSKCVACWITEKYGVDSLIFPAPESLADLQKLENNVANKILACVTVKDEDGVVCSDEKTAIMQLRVDAHAVKEAIHKELDAYIKRIRENTDKALLRYKAELSMYKSVDWEKTGDQIHDLVEYCWVALPFTEGGDSYQEQRKYLEALLAARKNTRDYQQVSWGGPEHKSSIDGHLESVIPEIYYPRAQHRSKQQSLAQSKEEQERAKKTVILFNAFGAGPSEQLSGVDLLKRRGTFGKMGKAEDGQEDATTEEGFLSTSHIAAQPYLERLTKIANTSAEAKNTLLGVWDTYIKTAQRLASTLAGESTDKEPLWLDHIPSDATEHVILEKYDGALLFGERLLEKAANLELYREIQNALKVFFDTASKLADKKIQPTPYYAIILADGDGMGEAIDHLSKGIAREGIEHHRQLSRGLDHFAQNVKKIVEQHHGALIYAGGDDVLAFLPLHRVLKCAQELKQLFQETMLKFNIVKGDNAPPTLSAGIVIVHHLELLQEALKAVRSAESKAKAVDGKNALAILMRKRSGEEYSVAGRWEDLDSYMEHLISFFSRDYIPRGMAYELREMALRLTTWQKANDLPPQLQAIIYTEAERIFRRKLELPMSRIARQNTTDKKKEQEQKKQFVLQKLCERVIPSEPKGTSDNSESAGDEQGKEEIGSKKVGIDEFINELLIAQELADAAELAQTADEKEFLAQ
jgi:CRISPR-associated protein Cmr2